MAGLFDVLLPYQKRILASKSSKIICCCSRQIGKSFVAAARAVSWAVTHAKSLTACISTGERAGKEFLLKCEQWAEACLAMADEDTAPYLTFTKTSTEIKFANGSRILILPAGNPSALRGYTGNVICDEFAIVENDTEVWAAIAPLLTNKISNKDKWIMVMSTPTGLNTEFAKIWNSPPELGWEKHRITIYDAVKQGLKANPEDLKRLVNDDLIWRTEYLCEFAASDDVAFPEDSLAELENEDVKYNVLLPVWLAMDVARTGDLSAIVVLQLDRMKRRFEVIEIRTLKGMPFNEQLQVLGGFYEKYPSLVGAYVDATGIGAMFAEEAARTISPKFHAFTFTAKSKTDIFERLRKTVSARNEIKCRPEDAMIIKNDLRQLRRMVNGASISYTAPHTTTGHADIATALAMAVSAAHDIPQSAALPYAGKRTSRLY